MSHLRYSSNALGLLLSKTKTCFFLVDCLANDVFGFGLPDFTLLDLEKPNEVIRALTVDIATWSISEGPKLVKAALRNR
jgi:hypothetical protein